jgi:hypothetical protein
LKKKTEKIRNPKSAILNNWADAFSAQRPCFRATSLLFRRKPNRNSEGGQGLPPWDSWAKACTLSLQESVDCANMRIIDSQELPGKRL